MTSEVELLMTLRTLMIVLLAVSLVTVTPGNVAATSGGPPVEGSSVKVAQTTISFEKPSGWVGGQLQKSESPTVTFGSDITFQNGSQYHLIIHDRDTGARLILAPNGTYTIPSTDSMEIYLWDVYGEIRRPIDVYSNATGLVNGGMRIVDSAGDFTTSGVVNISVAVVAANTNQVLARTNSSPYVLAHRFTVRQDGTSGTVTLSIARGGVPTSAEMQVVVFNASVNRPFETTDRTVVNLTYNSVRDTFTGKLDTSTVAGGVYGWKLRVYINGDIFKKTVHGPVYPGNGPSPYLLYLGRARPDSTIHTVPAEHDTIQSAIDAAERGDTISVAAGTYTETVRIDKPISLIGNSGGLAPGPAPNAPVLTGQGDPGTGIVIAPGVSDVRIKGFEIRNYTRNGSKYGRGINAHGADDGNIRITDNYIHNIHWTAIVGDPGTGTGQHQNWVVSNNVIADFNAFGIRIPNADNTVITNNHVTGTIGWPKWEHTTTSNVGILVEAKKRGTGPHVSHATLIANNTVNGSLGIGISVVAWNKIDKGLTTIDSLAIRSNTVQGNISYTAIQTRTRNTGTLREVTVRGNYLQNSQIGYLGYSSPTTPYFQIHVVNNSIINSQIGVLTSRNQAAGLLRISRNTLANNSYGVYVSANTTTTNVTITHNVIMNNSRYGAFNNGTGELNATYNWWGSPDGPSGAFSGSGDRVSQRVAVKPFYVDKAMTTLSDTQENLRIHGLPKSISVNQTHTLIVTVTDGRTNQSVGGVQVSLSGSGVNISKMTNTTGVVIFDVNASRTSTITVTASKEGYDNTSKIIDVFNSNISNPTLRGFQNPASNVDDDMTLEDTNGNGGFDIGDVQALYTHRKNKRVQNNAAKFDFNNNGGIDIGDIQALFQEYMRQQ